MQRIVITGAESTGKTTLAEALAGWFGEPWTPEFVRLYVSRHPRPLLRDDLEPIACGQLEQEDLATEKATRFLFHDTNLLSSIIYAKHYFDTVLDWVNHAFLQRDYRLYLLCCPNIPWVADPGQRESPQTRETLHEVFLQTLDAMRLPYKLIDGSDTPARLQQALRSIEALPASN